MKIDKFGFIALIVGLILAISVLHFWFMNGTWTVDLLVATIITLIMSALVLFGILLIIIGALLLIL